MVQFIDWTAPIAGSTHTPSAWAASAAGPATPAAELAASLSAPVASIAPKYFYDPLGSSLFTAICELPEYYPTRTEAAILARHRDDIARRVGAGCTLIDLGAGDCAKAASLFEALAPGQYVAVDISVAFLAGALQSLALRHPGLPMVGLGLDFTSRLALPDAVRTERRLFFYPGSSIGNFAPDDAVRLLSQVREAAGEQGHLLIGVDLLKPAAVLEPAYDDSLGVTAAFNLNVLCAVNRLLGADFSVRDWRHVAFLNSVESRIEMHLEARRAVEVRWPGGGRRFSAGERIHTENSYKYSPEGFAALLSRAGLRIECDWRDERGWFGLFLAAA
jgi:dimethylhistidine N-methyltransferase